MKRAWQRAKLQGSDGSINPGWALCETAGDDVDTLAVVVEAHGAYLTSLAWTADGTPRWHSSRSLDEALTHGAVLAGVAWD